MKLTEALQKGHGYARKITKAGNVYRAEENWYSADRTKLGLTIKLKHRSGVLKTLDKGISIKIITAKYGAEGWEPGM